ncbi:MAG TPA: hypothetical protein VF439_00300 [Candidatus Paceibacterota bacterium]
MNKTVLSSSVGNLGDRNLSLRTAASIISMKRDGAQRYQGCPLLLSRLMAEGVIEEDVPGKHCLGPAARDLELDAAYIDYDRGTIRWH